MAWARSQSRERLPPIVWDCQGESDTPGRGSRDCRSSCLLGTDNSRFCGERSANLQEVSRVAFGCCRKSVFDHTQFTARDAEAIVFWPSSPFATTVEKEEPKKPI